MTKPTGNPPGRPRGMKNRRTREVEAAAIEAAERIGQAVPDAFEGDAHALLMLIYKDPRQPVELRLEAAGKGDQVREAGVGFGRPDEHERAPRLCGER